MHNFNHERFTVCVGATRFARGPAGRFPLFCRWITGMSDSVLCFSLPGGGHALQLQGNSLAFILVHEVCYEVKLIGI